MRHAIIENGVVTNIVLWDGESDWTPQEGAIAVSCANVVAPGWTYDGQSFSLPAPTSLDEAKKARLAQAAGQRWQAAQTFTYGPYSGVASDDLAQSRLTSTVVALQATGSTVQVGWEMSPGVFSSMGLSDLVQFGGAMLMHVQACWAHYQALAAQIGAAADHAALDAIDVTAGWPN